MKRKLAVIGASYLQLPIVVKAKEMGLEVHSFAWEDGAICKDYADFYYPISILEKERIFEICSKQCIHGITTIASDAAVPTVSYVAEKLGLISNNYEDSLVATNKYEMRKRFFQHNVASPKFILANSINDDIDLQFPLIVKPTDRSGSRGVAKVLNMDELKDAVNWAIHESFAHQAIIEEFINGIEVSVEAISWQGEHYILAITDKVTTGEPHFVELEHHQPSQINKDIQECIKEETKKALTSLNIRYGASHSEFKITKDGKIIVIEVGARMGGDFIGSDLVMLSTGYDFLSGVINAALNMFTIPCFHENNHAGVFFLCEQTKNLESIILNASKFPEIVKSEINERKLLNVRSSADRSGYFIYQSEKNLIPLFKTWNM